jgi:hypothetical protein
MSVKRKKDNKTNTGMKIVGLRLVDDEFKAASTLLAEAIELRASLDAAMVELLEQIGYL